MLLSEVERNLILSIEYAAHEISNADLLPNIRNSMDPLFQEAVDTCSLGVVMAYCDALFTQQDEKPIYRAANTQEISIIDRLFNYVD